MSAVAIPEYAAQIAAVATDNKNVFESAIISLPAGHIFWPEDGALGVLGRSEAGLRETVARRPGF